MCQSLFFNKVTSPRPATLLKETVTRLFLRIFAKFLRTPFLQNTSGRLLQFTTLCAGDSNQCEKCPVERI